MPANARSVAVTDAYRDRLILMREWVAQAAAQRWSNVQTDDLDGSFPAWQMAMALILLAAQRSGTTLSSAYLAQFIGSETGRPVPTLGIDADRFAGWTESGKTLPDGLLNPLIATKIAIRDGKPVPEAMAIGRAKAVETVAYEATRPAREALTALMDESEQVSGWRRVTRSNACGACLANSVEHPTAKHARLKVHRFCGCVSEPVVHGVSDKVRRPTGKQVFDSLSPAEQDRRFGEKAKLIREGDVGFDALVVKVPFDAVPSGITEATYAQLRSLSK